MPDILRSLPAIALLGGLFSGLLVLGVRQAAVLEPVELAVYDKLLQSHPSPAGPDPRITLIAITEQDIRNQGRWPVTDATLARVLSVLARHEPRAIGLDLYRDIEVPPGHDELERILRVHPNIVCVSKFGGRGDMGIPPPEACPGEQVGFNDLIPDSDGVIRRALLFQGGNGETGYAFAVRLALIYLAEDGIVPEPAPSNPQLLKLGPTTFERFRSSDGAYVAADAGGYQIILNYQGPGAVGRIYTLTDLLSGRVDAGAVRDRIALVGTAAPSVPDDKQTPYGRISGVEMHAHAVSQLLRAALEARGPVDTWAEGVEVAWIVAWGLLGGWSGLWLRSPWRLAAGAAVGLIALGAVAVGVLWRGTWIPLVPAALAWVVPASIVTASVLQRERRERAVLRRLFGQHVSEEVAEAIWRQRDQMLEEGRLRPRQVVATVLFADFTGYTGVSEKMEPETLMTWLNAYLDALSRIVIEHHGLIDDYAGDAIKANFFHPLKAVIGEPVSEQEIERGALDAVTCAMAMEGRMRELNRRHELEGLPTVGMRIGIYTGPVVAGTVGGAQRMKYTTVGDSVNTAARLESLDRDAPAEAADRRSCRICIGETTAAHVRAHVRLRKVGDVMVKGKAQPVQVFQVLPAAE